MDTLLADKTYLPQTKQIISTTKFVFLNIVTFNLYAIWWSYKAWRFLKEHDQSHINPVIRTVFSLFTLYSLFARIKDFAHLNRYNDSYSTALLYLGIIITLLFAFLPGMLACIPLFIFYFFLRPFEALNHGTVNSHQYVIENSIALNTRQLLLVIIGCLVWLYIIFGICVGYIIPAGF